MAVHAAVGKNGRVERRPGLRACKILVVEDNFFFAREIGHVLRKVMAEVLGPVGQEHQALALTDTSALSCTLWMFISGAGLSSRWLMPCKFECGRSNQHRSTDRACGVPCCRVQITGAEHGSCRSLDYQGSQLCRLVVGQNRVYASRANITLSHASYLPAWE
jgi:hypothetical protein